MRAITWARKLLRSERGNVLVIGAATMPLMIGAAAVGIDTIQLSLWKRQLQRMADSGAIAGARALAAEQDADAAVASDLEINNLISTLSTDIQHAPEAGAFINDESAVRVVLQAQRTLPFWQMLMGSSPIVTVEATAQVVEDGIFCLLSLEESSAPGIEITGNSDLQLGCGIATNSKAGLTDSKGEKAGAITAKGSANLNASPVMAVGALNTSNPKFNGAVMLPYSGKQKDPFESLPDPSDLAAAAGDCSQAFAPGMGPGCYSGMEIDGPVALDSGTYIIKGNVNLKSKAVLTGTEVTIAITGDDGNIGTFDMDGQATLDLKAPKPATTSEPYPGVVLVRDRDDSGMDTIKINGGQTLLLQGAMYFPNTRLWFNGNSAIKADCLQIVAQQMDFKGGTDFKNDCKDGYGKMLTAKFVRLVG